MLELDAILRLPTAVRVLAERRPVKAITRPTDNAIRAEAEKFTSSIIRDLLRTLQVTSRTTPRPLSAAKETYSDASKPLGRMKCHGVASGLTWAYLTI
jgi:hypothetical protein